MPKNESCDRNARKSCELSATVKQVKVRIQLTFRWERFDTRTTLNQSCYTTSEFDRKVFVHTGKGQSSKRNAKSWMEYNGRTSKSHNSPSDKKNLTQRRPLTKVARQLASSVTESPFRPRKTPIKVARQLASLVKKPPFHHGVTTVHYRQPVSEWKKMVQQSEYNLPSDKKD